MDNRENKKNIKATEIIAVSDPALHIEKNETNNHAAVRYNAMKHGALSQNVVLPHEDNHSLLLTSSPTYSFWVKSNLLLLGDFFSV